MPEIPTPPLSFPLRELRELLRGEQILSSKTQHQESERTNAAAYTYLANSSLVGQITFAQSGTTKDTSVKQYDYLNRVTSISQTPTNSFAYQYNSANQRTVNRL